MLMNEPHTTAPPKKHSDVTTTCIGNISYYAMFPHCFLFHFFSLSFPIPVYDAIRNCQAKVFQTNKRKLMCEMHVKQKQQHNTSHLIAFYSLLSLSLSRPADLSCYSPELVRIERESRHFSFSFRTKNVLCWRGSGEVLAQEEEESGRRNAQGREPRRRNPNSLAFEYFIRYSNQMNPSTIQTLGRQLSQKACTQRVRLIGKTRRDGWNEKKLTRETRLSRQFPFCNMSSPTFRFIRQHCAGQ